MPTAGGDHMDGHASVKQQGFMGAAEIMKPHALKAFACSVDPECIRDRALDYGVL